MNLSELKQKFSRTEKIKKGGQKVVYKVEDIAGNTYAMKLINDANDPRVLQEIDIVKNISLSNVPIIVESGIVFDEEINESSLYIIEEYIEGLSLRDWLKNGNTATLSFAYKILHTLLSIEIELESNEILHRDINPNNIIIGNNGQIYLIDFGLAKRLNGTSLTQTNAINGPFTPGYAPHEQFANKKLLQDVRTDLFQIGVTIYESCTGSNPFIKPNENIMQIMSRTMTFNPSAISIDGDTKGMFAQLLSMLMAKNQSQRPNSAADAMRYLYAIKSTLKLED